EAASGKALATLHHDNSVLAVAFSPDGRTVLTGSGDKTARGWKTPLLLPVERNLEQLRAWVQGRTLKTWDDGGTLRELTQDERQQIQQRAEVYRTHQESR